MRRKIEGEHGPELIPGVRQQDIATMRDAQQEAVNGMRAYEETLAELQRQYHLMLADGLEVTLDPTTNRYLAGSPP